MALHPRTTQRIPNVPEYENHDGDWVLGRDTFKRYDEVSASFIPLLVN